MRDAMDENRLIELAALPAGDPRRAEAERDPRVRAWLLEHDAFVAGTPLSPEDEAEAARAADAALAKARAAASGAAGSVLELPRAQKPRRGLPPWFAAAAGLVIVAGAALVLPHLTSNDRTAFRSLTPGSLAPQLVTRPAAHDAAGRLVLRWKPLAAADLHRVEILRGLDAVATYEVAKADSLVLDPRELPAGDDLLWRVLALRDGAVLEASQPRALPR